MDCTGVYVKGGISYTYKGVAYEALNGVTYCFYDSTDISACGDPSACEDAADRYLNSALKSQAPWQGCSAFCTAIGKRWVGTAASTSGCGVVLALFPTAQCAM